MSVRITDLDRLERIPLDEGDWRPVRRALGLTGVSAHAYTAAAESDPVIERHDETSVEAPAGSMIAVGVGVTREAVATADETTVLVVGGPPGSALPPSPFEYWYAAEAPYLRGDYDEAVAVASEGLAEYPDHPALNFQLACYHALAGRQEEAIGHLLTAVEANPKALEWAAADADLDPIREHPRFPQLS
jgi:tetratricopeptide (TPR) repeat protein